MKNYKFFLLTGLYFYWYDVVLRFTEHKDLNWISDQLSLFERFYKCEPVWCVCWGFLSMFSLFITDFKFISKESSTFNEWKLNFYIWAVRLFMQLLYILPNKFYIQFLAFLNLIVSAKSYLCWDVLCWEEVLVGINSTVKKWYKTKFTNCLNKFRS